MDRTTSCDINACEQEIRLIVPPHVTHVTHLIKLRGYLMSPLNEIWSPQQRAGHLHPATVTAFNSHLVPTETVHLFPRTEPHFVGTSE